MRHAKTEWRDDDDNDHGWHLSDRGRRNATQLGNDFRKLGWILDGLISTNSTRTTHTLGVLYISGVGEFCTYGLYYAASADEMAIVVDEAFWMLSISCQTPF